MFEFFYFHYLQFQIIVPSLLINFWAFCGTPISYLDPRRLIDFRGFVLQMFQRLLKRMVLNKGPQKQGANEMEQEEQKDEYISAFDFLSNF